MSEIEVKPLPKISPAAARVLIGYVEVEDETGMYATMKGVASHTGLSVGGIAYHLPLLIDSKYVHRHPHRKREWEVTERGREWVTRFKSAHKPNNN